MGIQQSPIEPHWNYLLAIERDLEVLSRYVEFDRRNYECFSIEMARVLLAASAETDVVCKRLCKAVKRSSKADKIHKYRDELTAARPGIIGFGVQVPRFGLSLKPWDEWRKKDGVPSWWTAYNKIKHERASQFHRANLKNTLNAVAGLFVTLLYLYPEKAKRGELVPAPQLLRPDEKHCERATHHGFDFGINYIL